MERGWEGERTGGKEVEMEKGRGQECIGMERGGEGRKVRWIRGQEGGSDGKIEGKRERGLDGRR